MRPQGGKRLANDIEEKLHLHGKLPLPPGRQQGADSGGEVSNSLPASTCITFSECVRFPGKQELSHGYSIAASQLKGALIRRSGHVLWVLVHSASAFLPQPPAFDVLDQKRRR